MAENSTWMKDAADRLVSIVKPLELVTGEDLRSALTGVGFPEPSHPNAWGALSRELKTKDILVPTGEDKPMEAKKSNGRVTPLYFFQHPAA